MTATVQAAAEAIRDRLATIDGLNVYAFAPGAITPPTAVVTLAADPVDYGVALDDTSADYRYIITILLSRADDESGQQALEGYLDLTGTHSVLAAVSGTLGGVVSDADVSRSARPGNYSYAAVDYYGVQFDVTVMV